MPLFNEPKKKKTFREALDEGQTDFGSPELSTSHSPEDEQMLEDAQPIVAKEDANQAKPKAEAITPEDEKVGQFLQDSQTMDGPEKGAVNPNDVPSPMDFNSFYKKWKQVPTSLTGADKKMFTDRLAELDQKLIESESEYQKTKDRLAWAEVAETLGHALVQLMAAAESSRTGGNGVLKQEKNDWSKKADLALREYDSKRDSLSKQQGAVTRELERADSKVERGGRDEQKLLERDFFTTQARIQADAKREAAQGKTDADKERQAREKARMYIANYEAADDAVNKLKAGGLDDKEKQKLKDEVTDSLRKNGHIGVSKDLGAGGKAAPERTGGMFGFFQSDDYDKMQKFISANKKQGIKSVYKGYGLEVPPDVEQALSGQEQEAAPVVPGTAQEIPNPSAARSEPNPPGLEKKAPEMSAEDKAASDWANSNPQDPRAVKIKESLRAKGF